MVARINRARPGFTLIELLVVIAIIGVLISLLMAGVMKVRGMGKESQAKSDIRQLEVNINAYVAKNGTYLPSYGHFDPNIPLMNPNKLFRLLPRYDGTIPPASALNAPTDTSCLEWQYLSRIFPGLSPSNTGIQTARFMDSNETMVFFLTGGEVTQYSGFSPDARFPFETATQVNRKGKFFDIPNNRLETVNGVRTGRYLDPWDTPYAYIAPFDGKLYPATGQSGYPNPFRTQMNATTVKALKDGSFQIISAGPNKAFGPGGIYAAGTTPYSDKDPGGDDFSNFNNLKLSAPNN